jgi:BMFP domain-containing protein YqiC
MVEDDKGYIRGKPEHSSLISRQIAFDKIYKVNREEYPLRFKEYDIHHRDRKKHNNDVSNLDIVTREEHQQIHDLGLKGRKELYAYAKKINKKHKKKKSKNNKNHKNGGNEIFLLALFIIAIVLIFTNINTGYEDGEVYDYSLYPSFLEKVKLITCDQTEKDISQRLMKPTELYKFSNFHSHKYIFDNDGTKEQIYMKFEKNTNNWRYNLLYIDNSNRISGRGILNCEV